MMPKNGKIRYGSSMFEALIALCLLLYLFLAMLQIFQWIGRQMISEYASFYGTKALALGYAGEICRKSARVAGMGMSGRDISIGADQVPLDSPDSRNRLRDQASRYMTMGEGSGVNYEYWKDATAPQNTKLEIHLTPYSTPVTASTRLRNPPLLVPAMAKLLNLGDGRSGVPDAEANRKMNNYAKLFLEE